MTAETADLVQASILGAITTIALLGNILICIVVYKHSWILHPTNDFVISLAMLDILTATIPLPLTIGFYITWPSWVVGESACSVYGFFTDFPKIASFFTLAFIAIHRYYRFVKPHEYNETFTPGYTIIISICIWVASALFSVLPVMVSWAEYDFSLQHSGCLVKFKETFQHSMWNSFVLLLSMVIPTFLIFKCYQLVYRTIRGERKCRDVTEVNARPFDRDTKKYRLAKTFLVVSIVVVVCWLPLSIMLAIDQFFSTHVTLIGARVLQFSTAVVSASKVFIYGWFNRPFRREISNLFNQ